jgi:hypothetical protein
MGNEKCRSSDYISPLQIFPVVLENNNEHLTQLSAEGLPLFREPLQQDMPGPFQWVGPGEPGSAAASFSRNGEGQSSVMQHARHELL